MTVTLKVETELTRLFFLLQACRSIMWRKASAAALLALAVGYFYHGCPNLPENILQYISIPNLQSSFQNHNSQNSAEWIISTAWDTLITLPSRPWSRMAVGSVKQFSIIIVHLSYSILLYLLKCLVFFVYLFLS